MGGNNSAQQPWKSLSIAENRTITLKTDMELEIYQVAILLLTLFSGSDTRPAASRQTSIIRLQSSVSTISYVFV